MSDEITAEPSIDPESLVRVLLDETHQHAPPTHAERIARYLGLNVRGFSHTEFGLDERIRAFLWPAKQLIGVDRKLTATRRTYSILHEIGHYVLPGHVTSLSEDEKIVDEDRTLSIATVIKQETEANQFAADCLFQLDTFDSYVVGKDITRRNIQTVADDFGASFEATVRRWVEKSSEPLALVVFSPASSLLDAPLTVMYTITSEVFGWQFFSKLTPGQEISRNSFAYKLINNIPTGYGDEPEEEFTVKIAGDVKVFPMKLFTNSYRVFGILSSPES